MRKLAALALGVALSAPLAALAGGTTAPASEPPVAPPVVAVPVAVTPDWTGWYGGAALGYGSVGSNGTFDGGSGAIGGLLGGYRYDFGNWVGGVEADYDWSNIDMGNATSNASLDSAYRLKLQAGADLGRTFLYGTVGIARANTTVDGSSLSGNGWVAGIGADYAVSENWLVGGEALYNKFNDFGGSGHNGDLTTIKARVAYRF
jgi:outer membrane immunogenic protein